MALIGAVIAGVVAYGMLGGPQLYSIVGAVGLFSLMFPLQLFVLAAVACIVATLSVWRRTGLAALIAGVAGLALSALAVWPVAAQEQLARSAGVAVSLSGYWRDGLAALGKTRPPRTERYAPVAEGEQRLLDIWPATAPGRRPALVMIHGGGWVEGGRSRMQTWDRWGAALGYEVFDISYRLAPPARWLDEVGDVKCAIGWIKANADRLGVDASRISLIGYSAGGNLATLAAYSMGDPQLPPSCPVQPVKVKVVINLYGPMDLAQLRLTSATKAYVARITDQYVGGSPAQHPERYRLVSPLSHIGRGAPPTISFIGLNDRLVSSDQITMLDAALAKAGVRHESWFLPGADHVFDGDWGSFATQFTRAKAQAFLRAND